MRLTAISYACYLWDYCWESHEVTPPPFFKRGLVLCSVMNFFVGVCTCLSVCLSIYCLFWKRRQFHEQESQRHTPNVAWSCWDAVLHVAMRLMGPTPICSGLLPRQRLLKLTIIPPNLACVTAANKCTMRSPRAARETVSHFKCQNMLSDSDYKIYNIDRLQVLLEYEGMAD